MTVISLCHGSRFMSLCCVLLCHVLIFHALLCPFTVSCVLPSVQVCLPLSVSVFSSVLPPLITPPGLLPPLSPHLFLIPLLVSVHLASAFPLVFVCSLLLFLFLSGVIVRDFSSKYLVLCLQSPVLVCFVFELCIFLISILLFGSTLS